MIIYFYIFFPSPASLEDGPFHIRSISAQAQPRPGEVVAVLNILLTVNFTSILTTRDLVSRR